MGIFDGFDPVKAAEQAARAARDAANATKDAAEDAANATKDAAETVANETVNLAEDAAKATVGAAKTGINAAAKLSVDTVKAATNVSQDLARGDFNAVAQEGAKLASSALKEGIPVIQAVAKLGDGVAGEIEKQIDSVLSPLNLTLSDFTGPINKVTEELKGVTNYLITSILNEVLKILLLQKAKDAISDKAELIGDVVGFYKKSNKIPAQYYDYLNDSGLAVLNGFERGGELSEFPFTKHLGSSFSIGYDLDVGARGLNVGVSPALAIDTKGAAKGIFSYGAGLSTPGASQGIQFGYWVANTEDLEGFYWAVSLSAASAGVNHIGGSITVAFGLLNLDFQGIAFEISAAAGSGAGASIMVGSTSYIQ
ncbi:hypothetical protein NBRC116188_15540 [Oceaniserpentilla sp. 4NH20-0058]|uniref:hypothetical protein n=1 Tax=Oceaniserpentilla sp. 4NH20-0058 TaxID=3127660 RepID=UPI0031023A4C